MCTDRNIYWLRGHPHSIETPSMPCEYHLINLRFPSDSQIFPFYREKYLSNAARCAEAHRVIEFRFEHHVCEACELKEVVERAAKGVRERRDRKEEGLVRVAWREENLRRGRGAEVDFEEYLQSLKGLDGLGSEDAGGEQAGSLGVEGEVEVGEGGAGS